MVVLDEDGSAIRASRDTMELLERRTLRSACGVTSYVRNVMLMYHEVHPADRPEASAPASIRTYTLSEAAFGDHLAAIRKSGLKVMTAGESIAAKSGPDDSVVITFDDGWRGSLTRAVEMLAASNLHATFFITRDFIGQADFAAKEDLKRASSFGMEFGGHGTTHRYLGRSTPQEIRREFADVKSYLEDLLGQPVRAASVPGGDWSSTLARMAEDCGYECLCTSYPGVNRERTDRFRLYRMPIRRGMSGKTIENYLRFATSREIVRHRLLEFPKRLLGMENYARLRRYLLGGPQVETQETVDYETIEK